MNDCFFFSLWRRVLCCCTAVFWLWEKGANALFFLRWGLVRSETGVHQGEQSHCKCFKDKHTPQHFTPGLTVNSVVWTSVFMLEGKCKLIENQLRTIRSVWFLLSRLHCEIFGGAFIEELNFKNQKELVTTTCCCAATVQCLEKNGDKSLWTRTTFGEKWCHLCTTVAPTRLSKKPVWDGMETWQRCRWTAAFNPESRKSSSNVTLYTFFYCQPGEVAEGDFQH